MKELKPNNFIPFFKPTETIKFAKINVKTGQKTFKNKNTINESFKINTNIDNNNFDQIMKEY